jgi:hypothetical protein
LKRSKFLQKIRISVDFVSKCYALHLLLLSGFHLGLAFLPNLPIILTTRLIWWLLINYHVLIPQTSDLLITETMHHRKVSIICHPQGITCAINWGRLGGHSLIYKKSGVVRHNPLMANCQTASASHEHISP